MILGTGMRIGEVISLNCKQINWGKKEAKIVGKGNKERRVFFTQRSLDWLRRYLEKRDDAHEAVFVTRTEKTKLLVATGKYDRMIDERIAEIKKKCGIE